jgi:FkbM family methyltransferase
MKKIIQYIFSRNIFQNLFEEILNLCLKILNIGEGQSVETSGEKNVFKLLNKIHQNKELVIFDVGAHDGEWFKLLKKNYLGSKTVYSFEPSKTSFLELSKIKELYFFPINIALGNKPQKIFLQENEIGSSGAFITSNKNLTSQEVEMTTLDIYCNKNNINEIDLLKIDIEGYELKLLAGAKDMLNNKKIKLIQFEFGAPSEEKYSMKDFFNILDKDYQICRIVQYGYYPLLKYKHYYEINTVTNFIAIRRDLI